jgi:hypothetical protein
MSESADYDPGPWTGYDFTSLRKKYDDHVGRSYGDAVAKSVKREDCVPASLKTNCESPLVIACDVTGSMGEWPAVIFSKLPYLDLEGKEYLGEDMAISFAAVGDNRASDRYPLQVREFVSGKKLEEELQKLIIEGGGGGGMKEGYDLAAYYYAHKVSMPKAIRPIMIFIGDEGLYENLNKEDIKEWTGDSAQSRMDIKQIFDDLKARYSVYLIRKPYSGGGDGMSSTDQDIYAQWETHLGSDHIAILPEAGRVVDVIFGILAKETGRLNYFKKEIEDRQTKDQVKVVMKSLHTIHDPKSLKKLPGPAAGRSITRRSKKGDNDDTGTKSISLLDD